MGNLMYSKILEIQKFCINPTDVLEDQFDPQTEDYIERRKLMKEMKSQIKQYSKDLDSVFFLIAELDTFKSDIRFLNKTIFNDQGLKSLSKIYGQISSIIRELVKSDKKLQKIDSYRVVYADLSSALQCNVFDILKNDLDKYNPSEQALAECIESFKEGSKK